MSKTKTVLLPNLKKRSERRKDCALPKQGGSVLYVCTEFEADSSISFKIY